MSRERFNERPWSPLSNFPHGSTAEDAWRTAGNFRLTAVPSTRTNSRNAERVPLRAARLAAGEDDRPLRADSSVRYREPISMPRSMALFATLLFAMRPMLAIGEDGAVAKRVDELVEQLASKNPSPREVKGSTAEFPAGFDKNLQKPVYKAYRELNALGKAAFPQLIAHFDDARYALTADGGSMDKNFTVGELCYYLVELQIQPDKGWAAGPGDPRFRRFRPHFPTHIGLRDKSAALKWWEASKDKSLVEIQIAVTEWTIAEEEKVPAEFSQEEHEDLARRLRELRSTGKPLPAAVPWFR